MSLVQILFYCHCTICIIYSSILTPVLFFIARIASRNFYILRYLNQFNIPLFTTKTNVHLNISFIVFIIFIYSCTSQDMCHRDTILSYSIKCTIVHILLVINILEKFVYQNNNILVTNFCNSSFIINSFFQS